MVSHISQKIIIFSFLFSLIFFSIFTNNAYAQATETVSVSATVTGGVTTVTPTGGNTTGSIAIPQTAVSFSGQAYPNALVTLLKQGEKKETVRANLFGEFSITLVEKYNNNTRYSLFAEDISGTRSVLLSYTINVQIGYITQVSGIRFPPTILLDKSSIRAGDYITAYGYGLPQKEMNINISTNLKKVFSLTSSKTGAYIIVLPTNTLRVGNYHSFINYKNDSLKSQLVWFNIGAKNIFNTTQPQIISLEPVIIRGDTPQNTVILPGTPYTETEPAGLFIITALRTIIYVSLLFVLFILIIFWRRHTRPDDDANNK